MVGPEVARMIADFEDDTMTSHQKDSEHHHHEQSPSNMCKLYAVVEEMGSPFLEESEDLLVPHTRDNMNVTVWKTVRNVEIFGEELYIRFVNERFVKCAKSITEPLQKNKLHTIQSPICET